MVPCYMLRAGEVDVVDIGVDECEMGCEICVQKF